MKSGDEADDKWIQIISKGCSVDIAIDIFSPGAPPEPMKKAIVTLY